MNRGYLVILTGYTGWGLLPLYWALLARVPVAEAVARINTGAERIVEVEDSEIEAAMRHYFTDTHNIAEGAGAAGLAALLKERDRMLGRRVGVVLTGGNVDTDVYARVLANGEA